MADAVVTLPTGDAGLSLGWEVLWWSIRYIRQPDGPTAGGEWRFTDEQVRFLLWWYALTPAGRWRFMRGVLRRAKGWGKTPFVAAVALAELCGPVRFEAIAAGGETRPWRPVPYEPGDVIGRPEPTPWVQLAGVSLEQTKNTMSMVAQMCAGSPIVDDYDLDVAITSIKRPGGGVLERVTASYTTNEGARPTAVIEDETQHYTLSSGGIALDRVNRRNAGKSPGGTARVLETTNAHASGEGSVAEVSHEAWLAGQDGRQRGEGRLLYDSREAPPETDMTDAASLRAGLVAAYGDSTWVDFDRLMAEIWDPATPPNEARRFYLNQVASAVDAWMTQPEWAACTDATKVVAAGDTIVCGFDGSRTRLHSVTDATALIGCRVADGHLFELGVWEQPPGPAGVGWAVPQVEVDAAVAQTFATFDVVALFADPSRWESVIAEWERRYIRRIRVKASGHRPMQWTSTIAGTNASRMSRALDQFHAAVIDGQLTHDGSYRLTAHVLNARRRPRPSGMQIGKEHPESANKIDAAVAAVYAWQARLAAVSAGAVRDTFVPRRIR